MSCRIQTLEQTRLKLEETINNLLNRDIDLLVPFSSAQFKGNCIMNKKYGLTNCDCSITYQKYGHIRFLLVNAILFVSLIPGGTNHC